MGKLCIYLVLKYKINLNRFFFINLNIYITYPLITQYMIMIITGWLVY